MLVALTRQVSRSIANCELAFLERVPIDINRARGQHDQYEAALKSLGLTLLCLPEEPDLPDSVFVEDVALVLDECAVITRPGAASRRAETASVAGALAPYRQLLHIEPPGCLDGGDVLRLGKQIYIGQSQRTNAGAAGQLQRLLEPFGYEVEVVPVAGCLHLKSAVTQIGPDTLLINPQWVDKRVFGNVKFIEVEASEGYAANALLIRNTIVYPTSFPKTQERLVRRGIEIVAVEADELAKAEGAVTCCSLIFSA